jgi:putative endonuclease
MYNSIIMINNLFKRDEGRRGEDIAADYLRKLGFQIIDRNFRIRGGEIDIIALDGDTLVFIEVKTRSSNEFGTPLEAISYFKLKSLIKTAQFYKVKHPHLPESMRIDAVAVILSPDGSVASIELVKSIT